MVLFDDMRFGLRTMAKSPTSTGVAVVALALGIGANATVFAITNGVLFRNMPFVSDDILYLSTRDVSHGQQRAGVSFPDFLDWRAQAKSFQAIGADNFITANISDKDGLPTRYNVAEITANTFATIGQKPVMGRDFSAEDEKPGAGAVAILGHSVWENRYGKNASIVGQVIRINDVPTTVIGVMRPDLRFPQDADLWTALRPPPGNSTDELGRRIEPRQTRNLDVFARLAPGATERTASAEMDGIAGNLQRAYPDTNQGFAAVVHTFIEENNEGDVPMLLAALMGAVIFVLLIACANVANLLLARAVDRSREISIRTALGAGRWHIIRQLLVESIMLSIIGGFLGYLISLWGLRIFDAHVRDRIPSWMTFSMDYRGFAYLAAVTLGTGLLFGLAPALKLSRLNVNQSLREGGRGSSSGRGRYLSGVLVIVEMALAVILLAGAGVTIRSFMKIYQANPGVNTQNVLVMRLFLPESKYPHKDDQISFHDRLKARLDTLPGVEASAIASSMPTGGSINFPYELDHAQPVDAKLRPSLSAEVITADYFRVMGVPILQGRAFTNNDSATAPPVAIVNQRFAEKFWAGSDPLGKRFRIFDGTAPEPWLTVVGVAPNILQNGVAVHEYDPLIYLPYRQKPMRDMALMARTRVPAGSLATAFRQETQAVDQDMPLYNLRTLEERLAINRWEQGIVGSMLSIFAVIALALASIGLYAVIAHSVSQRTQEIGVRMALGASTQDVLRLVFRQGMLQLAIGLGAGLAASIGLTRVLKSVLVEVSSTDPVTFATVAFVLGTAAILGCWIPARRAIRVDPLVALRYE